MRATPDPASPSAIPARHIGILLFEDVEELDAVGPWEVLAFLTLHHPQDGFAVSCLSREGAPVTAAKGLVLGARAAVDQAPPLEVLVHPGGQGARPLLRHPAHLEWVRAQRAAVPLMTSVCTGSLVYAAAGLLAGRPATTHWSNDHVAERKLMLIGMHETPSDLLPAAGHEGHRPAGCWKRRPGQDPAARSLREAPHAAVDRRCHEAQPSASAATKLLGMGVLEDEPNWALIAIFRPGACVADR